MRFCKKIIANFLAFSMLFTHTAFAFNDIVPPQNIQDNPIHHIVVDSDRAGNTHLDRAQNGTPVININAASAGGVSANYYRDFNVNRENLILNNLQGEAGVSNLGGALHGNSNLNVPGTRAADIILNEVTSSRVTNLDGYLEVFGKTAEVIIANPNGIMVGGAGFINTSRLSLVTGASGGLDAGGNLNPFILSENPNTIITVVGRDVVDQDGRPVAYNLGIDMAGGSYVDLLSRIVEINGNILSGGAVNIRTGNDRAVKNADGEWTVTSTDKANKPEFAIDSTALGGIYAGRVSLIATEDGVGVRTRGDVIANIDDIKFDALGNIVIQGETAAMRDIKINTPKNVTASSEITAGRNIEIVADKVKNTDEIKAKKDLNITTNELDNAGGKLIALNDLNIDLGNNDWTVNGLLQSGGTLTLSVKNLTNATGDISGHNLVLNVDGDFINGTSTYENILRATNDLILNVTGDITNHGQIIAGRDANITSGGSIYNGIANGSDALIHAGRNIVMIAATSILNKGFLQAIGNLTMETLSAINGDYELNANAQNLPTDADTTLEPEYQLLYDDLDNLTDITVLSELSNNTKTAEQYYAVQNRLRLVKIQELLDAYTADANDISVANFLAMTESEIQESLQALLGEDYEPSEWTIDLTAQIANINQQITDQQDRWNQYNIDNSTTLTLEDYAALMAEDVLVYSTMFSAAQLVAETDRADLIFDAFMEQINLARDYQLLDWSLMDENDINDKLGELLGTAHNPSDWMIQPYQSKDAALTTAYLNSLRINNIDRAKVEKTGVHNDGRIYSGGNMSLTSNSVLHNNKGALIYSGGNAEFNVRDILFNNENAVGQGIFANGAMTIQGTNGGWLSQLINYYGTIESNGNMSIKANEVINYGSDSVDFSSIDNNIYEMHEYRLYTQVCMMYSTTGVRRCQIYREQSQVITKAQYDTYKAQGRKVTDTFLYYYVKDSPELSAAYDVERVQINPMPELGKTVRTHTDIPTMTAESEKSSLRSNNGTLTILADNITNYNSEIMGVDVNITAQNLLNTHLALNVNTRDYWVQRVRKCKTKVLGVCVDYHHVNESWTTRRVQMVEGTSPSKIVAKNNLNITANRIGNGTASLGDIGTGRLPYTPDTLPETNLQEIVRTGTIDPLANFKLPNGQYGIIRLGDILNGQYLYESDPLLVDLWHYLGSQYFMNRIGIDPHDVESKFIGDAFVEHEMIKRSLEQINDFRNTSMTDAQLDDYINNLYNALTAEKVADLGLVFGKPLTASQISQLDTDIVWYVKQEITLPNGEKMEVLVPQVYLAQSTLDELYSAALGREDVKTSIRGDNVSISKLEEEAHGVLTNMGVIVGNRSLVISTDEINNAARASYQKPVLRGGDLLVLNTRAPSSRGGRSGGTDGTINNIGGTIETTNSGSQLIINTGELNNITTTQQESQNRGNYRNVETHVDETATIQSAGDLSITTSGDLNMAGSKIAAADDAEINVGGNLNALSVEDYSYEYQKTTRSGFLSKKTNSTEQESINNIVSEISTGGDMKVNVGGDATFEGTKIESGGDVSIDAGGNVNMLAAQYYNRTTTSSSRRGFLGANSGSSKSTTETLTNKTSEISSGGDVSLTAGNDVNLIGTKVDADGDVNLTAGHNVNILSAVDESYATSVSTGKKGWGFLETSLKENISMKLKNQKSEINAGGNFNATSGNDVNIIGGDVNAYDGNINAGNRFNLFSVQDYDYDYSYSEKTGIDLGALGLQTLVTAATGVAGIFYPPALVSAGASAARMGDLVVRDHKRDGKEYEAERITQVQSDLNFENKFESYSENNTTIVSSNITAKNPDSKMETGEDGDIVVADLSDITRYSKSHAQYSPAAVVGFKIGSTPPGRWTPENGYVVDDVVNRTPTPVDEFIDHITGAISGLGEKAGNNVGGWVGNQIIKNTSGQKIEDLIMKYPKQWVADNTNPEFDPNLPPETPEPTRLQEYCDKDGCRINSTGVQTNEKTVESNIKFGE